MRGNVWLAAAVAMGSALASAAEFPAERMFDTVEVGSGVYAFVSPETNGPIPSGNVVAVVGDEGVLVVDTGRFPTLARRVVAEIRRRTDKPVRFVVHTHWHLDHIAADSVFRDAFPSAIFVAHEFTRRKIVEKQAPYVRDLAATDQGYVKFLQERIASGKRRDGSPLSEEDRRRLESQIGDLRLEMAEVTGADVVAPSLTFESALDVHLGRRDVRVMFLGKGNTAGDTVVSVPDARVVVTGDLLVSPVPYGYGCHPAAWVETLDRLMSLDAAAIVPGHGPVQHDWDYAKKVSALLKALRAQVAEAVAKGATLEQVHERVDLSQFQKSFAGDQAERAAAFGDYFEYSAVDRAYQEATGKMAEE